MNLTNPTIILLLLLALTGCSNQTDILPPEPIEATISLSTQYELTDADRAPQSVLAPLSTTQPTEGLKYIIEAWTVGDNPQRAFRQTYSADQITDLRIKLVPGTYDLLFWADAGGTKYTTESLLTVKMEGISGSRDASLANTHRDAFAAVERNFQWDGSGITVTLHRPLAVITLNGKEDVAANETVKIGYTNIPSTYNVLTGETSGESTTPVSVTYTGVTAGTLICEDAFFVPSSGTTTLTAHVGTITKTATVPLKPNHRTNITASFK